MGWGGGFPDTEDCTRKMQFVSVDYHTRHHNASFDCFKCLTLACAVDVKVNTQRISHSGARKNWPPRFLSGIIRDALQVVATSES